MNPVTFEEILAGQKKLVYKTKGVSMLPMLRENQDLVVIAVPKGPLKKYDVALYKRGKAAKTDKALFKDAKRIFDSIKEYEDSKDKIIECTTLIDQIDYDNACEILNTYDFDEGFYDQAIKIFTDLKDFKDSKEKLKEAKSIKEKATKYLEAEKHVSTGTEESIKYEFTSLY